MEKWQGTDNVDASGKRAFVWQEDAWVASAKQIHAANPDAAVVGWMDTMLVYTGWRLDGNASAPMPNGPILGRLCTHPNASACTVADGRAVLLANVSVVAATGELAFVATLASAGESVRWVDFALTDFPPCAVHNADGFALGPFGPLPVAKSENSKENREECARVALANGNVE